MGDEQASKKKTGQSWDEVVAEYLRDHPGFFLDHPQLLAGLRVPHAAGGATVSLVEKQIDVLRTRNRALQSQLSGLIDAARANESLSDRLHRIHCQLAEAPDLEDVLHVAQSRLCETFHLEDSVVRLVAGEDRVECVAPDHGQMRAVIQGLAGAAVSCLRELEPDVRGFLFSARAEQIRSVVIIALGAADRPTGVLALASTDPNRFHPDAGTVYLARLGEFLTLALRRFVAF